MKSAIRLFGILVLTAWIVVSCASPGSPDGGPYDEEPPHVVGSTPSYGALNTHTKKIEINFSEFIRIENANEKVVISPPQLNMPEINANGKKIKIELLDSLKENTTYTVDFSDAIVDNNEGNPLGKYTFVFSTGEQADSMEVSGKVLNASNLEPIKGILVGLHSDTTDTVFQHVPLKRVARTNGSGEFSIRGVANGKYRIYALQDADGDFTFSQKSEMIAFMPKTIETGSYPDARADTVWRDSTHIDSIRIIHFTHYTPDNVVLLAFLEDHQERHLLKTERAEPNHINVFFTAAAKEEPILKGLNFDEKDAFMIQKSVGNDTLQYWIKDTTLVHQDTLRATYTYMDTDTTGLLYEKTDTLEFVSKISRGKQIKLENEVRKKWDKEQEKLKKKGLPYKTEMPLPPLELALKGNKNIAPDENLTFETVEPIVGIDTSKIHLMLRRDSVYLPAEYLLLKDSGNLFRFKVMAEWRPQQEYQIILDSAAVTGVYGHQSSQMKSSVSIPSLDTYSSLFVNLQGINDTTAIVQLLNSSDKVVRSVRGKDGRAEFYFVKPGNYYLRLFIDKNGNSKWDPGDYEKGITPELTYYYPSKLNLRAKWDVEQSWNVMGLPFNKQKPMEITKQKPDRARNIQNRNATREQNKH